LNRALLIAAAALTAAHGSLILAVGQPLFRLLAVLVADAAALAYLAYAARRSAASSAAPAVPGPAPIPAPAAPVPAAAPAAPAASREEIARWRGQDEYLCSCVGFLDSLLDEHVRLRQVKLLMGELRSSLTGLDQLNANIQQNAVQVCGVAKNLAGSAEQGFTLSRSVQANVVSLAENITASLRETENLLEESKKISEILTIMSDIATTTNVLSINASIVAARAGVRGREFDVVAKEVRKLSVGTEESLTNISLLIKDIQNKIQGVTTKLESVNSGITREKDSMLTVAGALQGVTLAVEIIDSVTGLSGETAQNGQRGIADTLQLIDRAIASFTLDISEDQIRQLQTDVARLTCRG
jgi:hypothetical protein